MSVSSTSDVDSDFAKYTALYFLDGRVKTFKRGFKLRRAPLCTAQNFAEAGFYSVGTKKDPGNVKCFACGVELGGWEPDDDPWQEHVKRGAECPYVTMKNNKLVYTVKDLIVMCKQLASLKVKEEVEKLNDQIIRAEEVEE